MIVCVQCGSYMALDYWKFSSTVSSILHRSEKTLFFSDCVCFLVMYLERKPHQFKVFV